MPSIGIDFGTTNTAAALRFRVLPISVERGLGTMPSVVAYPPSGVTLVGSGARRRRAIDPKNTIFSAKRLIGRRWHAPEVAEFAARYPFDLEERDGGPVFKTRGGFLSPTEVAATILGVLQRDLPLSDEPVSAVITVPSRFDDDHRGATEEAARRAGFDDVQVIDEPVATATAYLAGKTVPPGFAVVYDLGGGTFDVALIDCRKKPFEVVAHGGDLYLGGDDIDHAIAVWAAEEIARQYRWDLRDDPIVFDRLVVACERAKIALCEAHEARIDLSRIDPAAPVASGFLVLQETVLRALALDLVYRTFVICDAVLADAGVRANQVEQVFLAGGTTQLPMVRTAVAQYFGREPMAEHSPLEVVSLGASLFGDDW
jgi:molecular chaperone DnaK